MTHRALLVLDSPSITRMYLKNRITFDQAFGIEEFFRWRNQANYEQEVKRKNQMIADFMRIRRQLKSRFRGEAELILNLFVQSPIASGWTTYDTKYSKPSGWMKDVIYFMAEKLDHLPVYFGEER